MEEPQQEFSGGETSLLKVRDLPKILSINKQDMT